MYIVVNIYLCYNKLKEGETVILFNKLFTLIEARGHAPTYWLRQNGVHPAVVNKMRKNEQVNTGTLNQICALLDCQPGDIMEYVNDEKGA
jgi:hypothetical protein